MRTLLIWFKNHQKEEAITISSNIANWDYYLWNHMAMESEKPPM